MGYICYLLAVNLGVQSLSRYLGTGCSHAGLEIRGSQEPRATLNSPAAPSNFWREPKNVLVTIHNTKIQRAFEDPIGLPGKKS